MSGDNKDVNDKEYNLFRSIRATRPANFVINIKSEHNTKYYNKEKISLNVKELLYEPIYYNKYVLKMKSFISNCEKLYIYIQYEYEYENCNQIFSSNYVVNDSFKREEIILDYQKIKNKLQEEMDKIVIQTIHLDDSIEKIKCIRLKYLKFYFINNPIKYCF